MMLRVTYASKAGRSCRHRARAARGIPWVSHAHTPRLDYRGNKRGSEGLTLRVSFYSTGVKTLVSTTTAAGNASC